MKKITSHILVCLLVCATANVFAQHVVLFDLTTDTYPEESSWTITNESEEEVAGEDSYSINSNTYPTVEVDLPAGNYVFTMSDEYGDGICCGEGEGFFTLTDQDTGGIIAEGSDFGSEVVVEFTLPYVLPVFGCTNPEAFNYNSLADTDDGSCVFEESPLALSLEEVASGFDSPVDIAHAGDDRLFIVEQDGYIQILNADFTTESVPFLDIDASVTSGGERGLLGLAFHPNYEENGYFYVNYTKNGGDSRISRFSVSLDPNVADPDSELIILEQEQPYSNHNAGDLAFGPDGYLYIPFGDGGSGEDPDNYGQTTATWLGKMLRIDVDAGEETYAIPSTNPFVGNSDYLPEIWAVGLRNTWRISFDAVTGDFWMADVGQYQWEEVNVELAGDAGGRNYGWRCYEGTHDFNTSGCDDESTMTWPVAEYNHSGGACSVTGGYVYRGDEFPALYGRYVYVDYCNGVFRTLDFVDDEYIQEEVTVALGFGWTTFGENSDLDLFVAKSNGDIFKIGDACQDYEVSLTLEDGVFTASEGDSYIWFLNNEVIEGADGQTLEAEEDGMYAVAVTSEDGCTAVSEELTTSISEIDLSAFVDVYPNPTADFINIESSINFAGSQAQIFDETGRLVLSIPLSGRIDRIDCSDLALGNYHLQILTNEGIVRKSFIILD